MVAIYWPDFCDFYLPLSHLTPSMRGMPSSYIWCGKTRTAELQYGEGRMMIDSVVRAQYIDVPDSWTDSHFTIANAAQTHGVGRQNGSWIRFGLYNGRTLADLELRNTPICFPPTRLSVYSRPYTHFGDCKTHNSSFQTYLATHYPYRWQCASSAR